jgi:hypothetical protein
VRAHAAPGAESTSRTSRRRIELVKRRPERPVIKRDWNRQEHATLGGNRGGSAHAAQGRIVLFVEVLVKAVIEALRPGVAVSNLQ